jgi:cyclic pyranopterin monophosphate synthase
MSTPAPDGDVTGAGGLIHVDEHGKAHMVDVTGKPATYRIAEARCLVHTVADVDRLLSLTPGGSDLLASARFAGIMAAKQTSVLIPLCHPIRLDGIDVGVRLLPDGFAVAAVAVIIEKTGVEMEALTACTTAALVLVHALWTVDPLASVNDLTLWHKSGGRSGTWERGSEWEPPSDPHGSLP